jgi:hypothetical protein
MGGMSAPPMPPVDPLPRRLIVAGLILLAIPCLFTCAAILFFGWPLVAAGFGG